MSASARSRHGLRLSAPTRVVLLALSIFTVTRLALLLFVGRDQVPLALWPYVFAKGAWFDLAALCFAAPWVLVYEALMPGRFGNSRARRRLRLVWLWLAATILMLGGLAEFTFWMEFSTRFNFIAVDYLVYTREVVGNIVESYPVAWLLAGVALAAAAFVFPLRHRIMGFEAGSPTSMRRLAYLGLALALPVAAYGVVDRDQMQGSGNAFADELCGNGWFTLAAAARRNDLDYERFYATLPQARADAILARSGALRASGSPMDGVLRETAASGPGPFKRRPKNVVLITVESLSARFLGSYGSTARLTPNLDRLAEQGLRFDQVFATGTRTVRGLEALSMGTPPIPGRAIVRRPGNDHLTTLGGLLSRQGFHAYFIYGGYGYFDNMNAYFRANGYRVIDRTDFPSESIPMENIWGVADEALFDNVLPVLDRDAAAGTPFLAHLMTTSNHRPYTYPDGRIDIPSPGGRNGAVKYTDYAIGRFIDRARTRPWFDDTLFVIIADHCSSAAGRTRLPVEKYHIPLIFYAPALLDPGVDTRLMSQIDVVPTLLDALGRPGAELFFGHSRLRDDRNPEERAFISNYQELGFLKDGVLTILSPRRRVEAYRIDPETHDASEAPVDPILRDEAIAWYQTAAVAFDSGALRSPAPPSGPLAGR